MGDSQQTQYRESNVARSLSPTLLSCSTSNVVLFNSSTGLGDIILGLWG